jgi:predicted membrane-bound spermidine synthase
MRDRLSVRALPFLLFALSGFCGLLYQVVWVRLAFARFGVITPVLSVVLSVFMAGQAVGSWAGGRWATAWTARSRHPVVWLYGVAELFIGASSLVVPWLLRAGETALLPLGTMASGRFLAWSAAILAAVLLPWCIAMGTTYPLMMAHMRSGSAPSARSFSLLYLGNVAGAVLGTLLSACVLIEALGFRATLWVAGAVNLLVAATAFAMGRGAGRTCGTANVGAAAEPAADTAAGAVRTPAPRLMGILFLTGFVSMAMEVVWTRAFTPVLETTIYAFASVLAAYLLSTVFGSWLYRRHVARGAAAPLAGLAAALAWAAFVPPLLNDPRLSGVQGVRIALTIASLVPFCALLGYVTPQIVDACAAGEPRAAGRAYAVNVLGCILGPLCAGYLILPFLGVRQALVLLALPCAAAVWMLARPATAAVVSGVGLLLAGVVLDGSRCYEDGMFYHNARIRRDHVATVISCGEGFNRRLLVNGVGMTMLTPTLKVMSHLPLGVRSEPPRSGLVICLGMGAAFRSMSAWDIPTTAVELVPSVCDAFPFYFGDAGEVLARPANHVVVDDGRRFLRRTAERYDVIVVDPPPPVEAAGTSLLYSREFHDVLKSRLAPGGVLAHWFPGGEGRTTVAVARSLAEAFPHVRVFRSVAGWGFHFLCSEEPIEVPPADVFLSRMPARARLDFAEWYPRHDAAAFYRLAVGDEVSLPAMLVMDPEARITDDRPFNEYFLLRRLRDRVCNTGFAMP